jgi:hypothetical protein
MRPILAAALMTSLTALLVACAGTPRPAAQAPQPVATSETPAVAAKPTAPVTSVNASNIADAQKAGYRVVNEKGTQLLCRKSLITGTRLKYQTTCLTAEQYADQARAAQDAMRPPPETVPRRD